jgi:hypothetical protein
MIFCRCDFRIKYSWPPAIYQHSSVSSDYHFSHQFLQNITIKDLQDCEPYRYTRKTYVTYASNAVEGRKTIINK